MPLVTSYLVFDIETVVDPDLPIAEGTDAQKIPATPHHQIVALGALLLSGPDYEPKRLGIVGRDSTDERVILLEFTESRGEACTHAGDLQRTRLRSAGDRRALFASRGTLSNVLPKTRHAVPLH